jgi:hypothetical protein
MRAQLGDPAMGRRLRGILHTIFALGRKTYQTAARIWLRTAA